MHPMFGDGTWWSAGEVLTLVLLFGILALGVGLAVWAFERPRVPGTSSTGQPARDPAEDRLRERYAIGEIDADEFERRLATLRSD
ncbi:MAG TPA: SHOCT domain-containing protein [Micromonosporaceae bacterium]|jgi:uncharacterized membrane protein|nr:SHOCT domain-containing protein [Micromonosporaceae bacterium]